MSGFTARSSAKITALAVLFWCVATIAQLSHGDVMAQPAAAPSPTASAPRTGDSSRSTADPPKSEAGALICDFSGNVCVPAGKSAAIATPGKVSVSPAAVSTPQASKPAASKPEASKITASEITASKPAALKPAVSKLAALKPAVVVAPVASSAHQLICDPSGKVCVDGTAASVHSAQVSSVDKKAGIAIGTQATAAISGLSGSKTPTTEHPSASSNQTVLLHPTTPSQMDGVSIFDHTGFVLSDDPMDWAVRAYKSRHLLEVYFQGHLLKHYHAVFGRSLAPGAKLWEGDRRTPEGNYLIIGKHRSSRFGWFLHINYPNADDQQRFEQTRAAHLIPASAGEGGQIGIHGTDNPYLNIADVNWTTGCISVDNTDIKELAQLLPVGTLVVIKP
jgi:hypothetical protein